MQYGLIKSRINCSLELNLIDPSWYYFSVSTVTDYFIKKHWPKLNMKANFIFHKLNPIKKMTLMMGFYLNYRVLGMKIGYVK